MPVLPSAAAPDSQTRSTIRIVGSSESAALDRMRAAIVITRMSIRPSAPILTSISHRGTPLNVPAFLIHDSPREADLGLSIYHRLFRLVTEIEGSDEPPQFQYIVTTTTRPPEDLAAEPWLRLTLRGSQAPSASCGVIVKRAGGKLP